MLAVGVQNAVVGDLREKRTGQKYESSEAGRMSGEGGQKQSRHDPCTCGT